METPAIDVSAIQRLRKWGGEELPLKMLEIFLSHTPARMVEIRRGVEREDAGEVEKGAHSLKSSAGNVGAFRLQALCQAAEMMAEAEDFPGLRDLFREIAPAYEAARAELEKIREGMQG